MLMLVHGEKSTILMTQTALDFSGRLTPFMLLAASREARWAIVHGPPERTDATMDESPDDDRGRLALRVGAARSACTSLALFVETLEDREAGSDAETMELLEGLAFLIGAVGRELAGIQAALADGSTDAGE